MIDLLLDMFSYPFMQRAFLAGGAISLVLGWLGVFVTSRKMSFVGDGIAHASLLFIALGVLFGGAPLIFALYGAVLLGIVLYLLDRYTNLSGDMAVGILFTTGMALGIIVLQWYDGYVPELMSFLFGSVLAIKQVDVWVIVGLSLTMLTLLTLLRKNITFLTLDKEGAFLSGVRVQWMEFLFYIMIALSVVMSIKLIGIILVSALLIIPSAVGRHMAKSFFGMQMIAMLISFLAVCIGLIVSFFFDLPSGATIVLVGVTMLGLSYLWKT